MINKTRKKGFKMPTAYSVLLLITLIVVVITQFIPQVISAKLSDLIMAPINGLNESIDVSIFVLLIGGFLGIVTKTGALDAGIGSIVKRLNGNELILIPILMFIFSLGGTSFGMAEETLAFYALITATMIAAGFDQVVAVGTVALGAGSGVLGSTSNPFLVSTSIDALSKSGIVVNQAIVIGLGIVLWISSLLISIYFVMDYAKKVKANKNSSILTKEEIENGVKAYADKSEEIIEFTTKRKIIVGLFALSFIVMVLGIIPWERFGINIFKYTAFLTGKPLGSWWFSELSIWFVLMSIIIGIIHGLSEKEIAATYIEGAAEMVGVALIVGVSRGISVVMSNTGLDAYILQGASNILSNMSSIVFTNVAYVIYIGLSFLIPSSSGLAGVSMPIFGPLTENLGFSSELLISIFSAGNGLVNIITPTSGVVIGGLAIAKVEFSTWVRFVFKILVCLSISSTLILSIAMMLL